jgi:hypothetical protein
MASKEGGDATMRNIHLLAIIAGLAILVLVLYFAGVL